MTPLSRLLLAFLLLWFLGAGFPVPWCHAQPDVEPTFSLSCRDARVRHILGALAVQNEVSIAGLDAVPKSLKVSISLYDVDFEAGLRAVLEPVGFTFDFRDGIYFIRKRPPLSNQLSLEVAAGLLTLSADGVEVNAVIRALSETGISITGAEDLTGTITAYLQDQPIDSALPILFASFILHETDGIYTVAPKVPLGQSDFHLMVSDGGIEPRVSVTARNHSLTELLSELAHRAKIDLSIVGEIERRVTLRLGGQTPAEMLTALAKTTGYTYRLVDGIHYFGQAAIQPDSNSTSNPLIQRKTLWLKHLPAKDVLNLLPASIPKQNVTVSPVHNTVTIVGSLRLIQETEQFLAELDRVNDAIRGRQAEGAIAIEVSGEGRKPRLTVDIKDAPLFDVMRQLSIETGVDVVFLDGDDATGEAAETTPPTTTTPTVTLRRTGATLERVLDALFLDSIYTYKWTHGHQDESPMLIIGQGLTAPFAETELIALNHLDVVKVIELLPATPDVIITPLLEQNAVLARGTTERIAQFRRSIQAIDVPHPQAMIQLYLLELTHGTRDELGLTIEGVDHRTTLTVDNGIGIRFDSLTSVPHTFGAKLNALVKQNRGKLLANPSLAVVNGQQAKIDIGGKHLFETHNPIYTTFNRLSGENPSVSGTLTGAAVQTAGDEAGSIPAWGGYPPSIYRSYFTIETGLRLELIPSIGASGEVRMDLQLSIRDADALSREASSLSQRLITTTISVPDKGMVVIGGLLQEKEKEQVSRLPLLWRLPLIGKYLFTSKETTIEQTELVVIIQPKVIQR